MVLADHRLDVQFGVLKHSFERQFTAIPRLLSLRINTLRWSEPKNRFPGRGPRARRRRVSRAGPRGVLPGRVAPGHGRGRSASHHRARRRCAPHHGQVGGPQRLSPKAEAALRAALIAL